MTVAAAAPRTPITDVTNDMRTTAVVDTITVGNDPYAVAVSPTGPEAGDIYVTNAGDGTLSIIDPSDNTVIDTINLGNGVDYAVAVSPTGPEAGDIYVGNYDNYYGTVSVIDPSDNMVVATIPDGGGPDDPSGGPVGVAVSPTGPEAGDIYVANNSYYLNPGSVSVIDPSDNTIINTIPLDTGPQGVAVSPIGPEAGDIYVANGNGYSCDFGCVSVIAP